LKPSPQAAEGASARDAEAHGMEETLTLQQLAGLEPWQWPDGTPRMLLSTLSDLGASEADLLVASVLAGDTAVIDDALAERLLALCADSDRGEELRCRAAISLGPVLEECDTFDFDDGHAAITESTFRRVLHELHALHQAAEVPEAVRRCVLEAAVRAPQEWHPAAVGTAWSSPDAAWQRTAVFCMRFVPGFEPQILEAMQQADDVVFYQAVLAAGSKRVQAAWDQVVALLSHPKVEKPLLLAAVDTVACLRPTAAPAELAALLESGDEDVVEAIHEALAMGSVNVEDDDGFLEDDVLADVEPGGAFLSGPPPAPGPAGQAVSQKVGRNEPCPCGSSKKYKKCCGS
jgi:hypothetical protein